MQLIAVICCTWLQVAALIPEGINDIHLADLAPQYMDDKSFGNSLYQNSYHGQEVN